MVTCERYDPHSVLYLKDTAENVMFEFWNKTFVGENDTNHSITLTESLVTNYTQETAQWEVTHTGYHDPGRFGEIIAWACSEYLDCWDPAVPIAGGYDEFYGCVLFLLFSFSVEFSSRAASTCSYRSSVDRT